jgi:hypothetical protein
VEALRGNMARIEENIAGVLQTMSKIHLEGKCIKEDEFPIVAEEIVKLLYTMGVSDEYIKVK